MIRKIKIADIVVGIILIMVAIGMIIISTGNNHYTAKVKEVNKTEATGKKDASKVQKENGRDKTVYRQTIIVTYSADGTRETAQLVIKRKGEKNLVKRGDKIKVNVSKLNHVTEYKPVRFMLILIVMLILGCFMVFSGIFLIKVKKPANEKDIHEKKHKKHKHSDK